MEDPVAIEAASTPTLPEVIQDSPEEVPPPPQTPDELAEQDVKLLCAEAARTRKIIENTYSDWRIIVELQTPELCKELLESFPVDPESRERTLRYAYEFANVIQLGGEYSVEAIGNTGLAIAFFTKTSMQYPWDVESSVMRMVRQRLSAHRNIEVSVVTESTRKVSTVINLLTTS